MIRVKSGTMCRAREIDRLGKVALKHIMDGGGVPTWR